MSVFLVLAYFIFNQISLNVREILRDIYHYFKFYGLKVINRYMNLKYR